MHIQPNDIVHASCVTADNPEIADVSCIKVSAMSPMPCEACLVPKDKRLCVTAPRQQQRTDAMHAHLIDEVSAMSDAKQARA
eukprot:285279-Chlamydomonas_euryale.AAC.1